MLAARRLVLALTALACALLVLAPSGMASPAPQASSEALRSREALLSQERYLSSFGSDPATVPSPEERYYSSYGDPEPLTAPQAPEPSAATPWATLAASIAGAGTLVLLGVIVLRRRHAGSADPGDSPEVHAILRVWSRHRPQI